jgi:hypothetical protein
MRQVVDLVSIVAMTVSIQLTKRMSAPGVFSAISSFIVLQHLEAEVLERVGDAIVLDVCRNLHFREVDLWSG